MTALTILQSIAGVMNPRTGGVRLATIDPDYSPYENYPSASPLPKVTFDGETTLSGKRYPFTNGYLPYSGDRVLMIPVGNTYVIVGKVTSPSLQGMASDNASSFADLELGSGAYYDTSTGLYTTKNVVCGNITYQYDSWTSASLQNSWTTVPGDAVPSYKRVASPDNAVWMVGDFFAGTVSDGTTVFTLPSGYRPAASTSFPIYVAGAPSARFDVTTAGLVRCWGMSSYGGAFTAMNVLIPMNL